MIYTYDPKAFEVLHKDDSTADYMISWNYAHNLRYKLAKCYVTKIRNAQHAASSEAIRQILA